jgi:hypothetical protein
MRPQSFATEDDGFHHRMVLNSHVRKTRVGRLAAANDHPEIVWLLLDTGTGIDAKNGYSGTAPQAAAVHGRTKVVRLLPGEGMNWNVPRP